jgi:hypothetical protein
MAKVQSKSAQPALRRQSILSFELREEGGGGAGEERRSNSHKKTPRGKIHQSDPLG